MLALLAMGAIHTARAEDPPTRMFESEGNGKCGDCGGETWYIFSRSHAAATACKDEICMFF
jgi:hypothetical protein